MATSYSTKLKDPRWQKRRLQILQRDDWRCQSCDNTDKTLHVHHKMYIPGKEPWDYPDNHLIVLCEECHQGMEDILPKAVSQLAATFKLALNDPFIWSCAIEMFKSWEDLHRLVYLLWELRGSEEEVMKNLVDLFRKTCQDAREKRIHNNQQETV